MEHIWKIAAGVVGVLMLIWLLSLITKYFWLFVILGAGAFVYTKYFRKS